MMRLTGMAVAAGLLVCAGSPLHSKAAGGPAAADQANAEKTSSMESLMAALHSEKYQVREDATMALLRLPAERLSDIEQALAAEADPEAIVRLTRVAVHLYLKARTSMVPSDHAWSMMGIALAVEPIVLDPKDEEAHAAIVVTDVKSGFPAMETLKPGDRIIGLAGKTFPGEYEVGDFQREINGKLPGDFVDLTVLRNHKQFQASVQLAARTMDAGPFIEQREEWTREYLLTLKKGLSGKAVVMRDTSPRELHGGEQIDAEGGVIINQGGAIIQVAPGR
jgi:C-terminal processing protease CtpA/Prc